MIPQGEVLDPTLRCSAAREFETNLQARVIGQGTAVETAARMVQTFMAGFQPLDRPAGTMLMLGPTGTGKTRLVEALAEVLFGNRRAFYKIACAEYGDSYQTNRLLGAPPGYIGFSEGTGGDCLLSQAKIDQYQTSEMKLNLVLFDEIEKGSDRLFDVMLNLLDKGEITLSNGQKVDFTKSLIFMTSNLGATRLGKGLGFTTAGAASQAARDTRAIAEAVKLRFRPEFLNRIDYQVTFEPLDAPAMRRILALELEEIRKRLQRAATQNKFVFTLTRTAEDAVLAAGASSAYGARALKRVLETEVVQPLANLSMSGQVGFSDMILVDYRQGQYEFRRFNGDEIANMSDLAWGTFRETLVQAVAAPIMTPA